MTQIPVYCFHHIIPYNEYIHIEKSKQYLFITVEKFEKLLILIKKNKMKTLTSNEFIDISKSNKGTKNTIFLTFDDGRDNQYKYAYPLLKKYNINATFFIITSKIGCSGYITHKNMITMNNIIDYQIHTHDFHDRYIIKNSSNIEKYKDIIICIEILKKYNKDVKYNLFAFPFTSTGPNYINIINSGLFDACFTGGSKIYNSQIHSIYNIPRFVIS